MSGVPQEDHDSKMEKLVLAFPTIEKAKIARTLLLNGGDINQTAKILEREQSTASETYNLDHADEVHHFGHRSGPTYDYRQTNRHAPPASALSNSQEPTNVGNVNDNNGMRIGQQANNVPNQSPVAQSSHQQDDDEEPYMDLK